MAKTFKAVKTTAINGLMSSQEFNPLATSNQVGDKFYVPEESMLLILGTEVDVRDRSGNLVTNETGEVQKRAAAQRFVVVKLDEDNNPIETRELYVGQVVKTDAHGTIAYPGVLSTALRRSSDAFKAAICGKILSITDTKTIDGRVWDNEENAWKRDEDGNLAFAPAQAFKFVAEKSALNKSQLSTANAMLGDTYVAEYSDYIIAE